MIRIFAYAKCGTCQKALKFLAARKLDVTVIPIREQPPTKAELKRMLWLVDGNLRRLFNTSGQDYKALNMKTRLPKMTEPEALELLSKHGNLIKRPFLLTDTGGTVGFDEAEWKRLLS
jgi:Spx/MgsR family transcriptional regulator